jgi:hypothetical protein
MTSPMASIAYIKIVLVALEGEQLHNMGVQ